MKTLALVMIVKDEENNIQRCIDSVTDLVNEIIVVDTGSIDNTRKIAKENGAKVFDFDWQNDFSNARNFSIKQSSSDWNLVLDADEYILSNHQLIREFIENNDNLIGRINILSNFLDNGQEMVESSYVSRLFPNNGIYFTGKVHEQLETRLPLVDMPVSVAHDGYFKTNKTDRNLPILLEELKISPSDPYILYQIGKQYYLKSDYFKANKYFSKSYTGIENNADFKPKLVVDYMYSLIKSGNLEVGLRIIENEKNNLSFSTDFHFVCGIFFMELVFSDVDKYINYFPLIEQEYLRCLEIAEDQKRENVKGTGSFLALFNLGTFFETTGNTVKAIEFYKKSAKLNFKPAQLRLKTIS